MVEATSTNITGDLKLVSETTTRIMESSRNETKTSSDNPPATTAVESNDDSEEFDMKDLPQLRVLPLDDEQEDFTGVFKSPASMHQSNRSTCSETLSTSLASLMDHFDEMQSSLNTSSAAAPIDLSFCHPDDLELVSDHNEDDEESFQKSQDVHPLRRKARKSRRHRRSRNRALSEEEFTDLIVEL